MSLHTRLLRPSTNFRPFLQCILRSSRVVDNAREDPFLFPQIFMLQEVHLRKLATETHQITPSWKPLSCGPKESDYCQRAPTCWTRSASWIQGYQRFSWRLGRVSLPWPGWKHRKLGVSTTATSSTADWNIPRRRRSADHSHCWAMGTQCSGLPWDKPTKQPLLPVCDVWRVQIYPVWDQQEGHEHILWQRAEGGKHCSAFPNHQIRGWRPKARG